MTYQRIQLDILTKQDIHHRVEDQCKRYRKYETCGAQYVVKQRVLTHDSQSDRVTGTLAFCVGGETSIVPRCETRDALQHQAVVTQNDSRSHVVVDFMALQSNNAASQLQVHLTDTVFCTSSLLAPAYWFSQTKVTYLCLRKQTLRIFGQWLALKPRMPQVPGSTPTATTILTVTNKKSLSIS